MSEPLVWSRAFADGPRVRAVLGPGFHNLDTPLVDQYGAVEWTIVARRLSDNARAVYHAVATHDGGLGVDATTGRFSAVRQVGEDFGADLTFACALTGTGGDQVVLLTVTIVAVSYEVSYTRAPLIGGGE